MSLNPSDRGSAGLLIILELLSNTANVRNKICFQKTYGGPTLKCYDLPR